MTSVVVDASVIVACAISDGKARRTLLSATGVEFYAPAFVQEEVRRRSPKVIMLSGVGPTVISTLLDDLFSRIAIVPREAFESRLSQAIRLADRAGAMGDEDYIALALVLAAPIWTYDNDFHRIKGIRVVSREQVERGLVDE